MATREDHLTIASAHDAAPRRAYVNPNLSSARMFVSFVVALIVHVALLGGAAAGCGGRERTAADAQTAPSPTYEVTDERPTPAVRQSKQPSLGTGVSARAPKPNEVRPAATIPTLHRPDPGPDLTISKVAQAGSPIGQHLDPLPGPPAKKASGAQACGRASSDAMFFLAQRLPRATSCTAMVNGKTYTVSITSNTISPSRESNECAPASMVTTILNNCK